MSPKEEERLRMIIREELALIFSPSPNMDLQRIARQNVEAARKKQQEKLDAKQRQQ